MGRYGFQPLFEGYAHSEIHTGRLYSVRKYLMRIQPSYLGVVLVSPTLLCAKLTFFLLYFQIFWPSTWLRKHIYMGAGLTTAFYLSVGIAQFVLGAPVPSLSPSSENWYHQATVLSIIMSAVGFAIDLYILILPIGGVWQLHLTTRRKVGVMLIFMTGTLCATLCFTKFISLTRIPRACLNSLLSLYYRIEYHKTKDKTWVMIPVFITS